MHPQGLDLIEIMDQKDSKTPGPPDEVYNGLIQENISERFMKISKEEIKTLKVKLVCF
jgi:hypothetical protein